MIKDNVKKIFLAIVGAILLMTTIIPYTSFAEEGFEKTNIKVELSSSEEIFEEDEFDINVSNNNEEDSTILSIPEEFILVTPQSNKLYYSGNNLIVDTSQTSIRLRSTSPGDFTVLYSNLDSNDNGTLNLHILKVEEPIEEKETIAREMDEGNDEIENNEDIDITNEDDNENEWDEESEEFETRDLQPIPRFPLVFKTGLDPIYDPLVTYMPSNPGNLVAPIRQPEVTGFEFLYWKYTAVNKYRKNGVPVGNSLCWKQTGVMINTMTSNNVLPGFAACPEGWSAGDRNSDNYTEYTATAIWKNGTELSFAINYNPNGGQGTMNSQVKKFKENLTLNKNTYSRDGYKFDGWSTSAGGSKIFSDGQVIDNTYISSNTTLYAVWEANKYQVEFNANGGSGSKMQNQSFDYGSPSLLNLNMYFKEGHRFLGWAESAEGPVKYNDGQNVSNLVTSGTKVLFAKWEPIKYHIRYNANGGTGTMNTQTVDYGQKVALNKNTFTRKNQSFVGWSTAPGSGAVYTDQQQIENLSNTQGSVLDLYAVWTSGEYEIVDGHIIMYNSIYSIKYEDYPVSYNNKVLEAKSSEYGNIRITRISDGKAIDPIFDFTNYKQAYGQQSYTFEFNTGVQIFKRTIRVNISDNSVSEDDFTLITRNAYIGLNEAKDIVASNTGDKLVKLTDAKAISKKDGKEVKLTYVRSTPTFSENPNTYTVVFKSAKGTEIQAQVTVLNYDEVKQEGNYVIAANDFAIGRDDIKTGNLNLRERANAIVFEVNTPNYHMNAKATTTLIENGDVIQTVNFIPENPGLPSTLQVNVKAKLFEGTVVEGNEYIIVLDKEKEITPSEAKEYIKGNYNENNPIIKKVNAKSYKKTNLNAEAGTVVYTNGTFTETAPGTASFTVKEDTKNINAVSKINISTAKSKPEITVNRDYVQYKIGADVSNAIREGVSAKDMETGSSITFESGKLTSDITSISSASEGIYTITYNAVDSYGTNADPKTRVIIISDRTLPEIGDYVIFHNNLLKKTSDYTSSDSTNSSRLITDSNAYAISKKDGSRKDVVVSNLNGFTNKAGSYNVKLKVKGQDSGLSDTVNLHVVLTDNTDIIEGPNYYITANDKTVSKSVADAIVKDKTNTRLFVEMNVSAVNKYDSSEVKHSDIVVTNKIEDNEVQSKDITFSIKNESNPKITKKLVVVEEEEIDNDGDNFIGASPFVIGKESINGLSDQMYIDYGGARGWKQSNNAKLDVIVTKKLDSTSNAEYQTVTYKLRDFNAEVTVRVKILSGKTVLGDNYILSGNDFNITGPEAYKLVSDSSKSVDYILVDHTDAKLKSYKKGSHNPSGTVVVSDRSKIKTDSSTGYPVKFKVHNGVSIETNPELTLNVGVTKGAAPTIRVKNVSYLASGKTFNPKEQFVSGSAFNDGISVMDYDTHTSSQEKIL